MLQPPPPPHVRENCSPTKIFTCATGLRWHESSTLQLTATTWQCNVNIPNNCIFRKITIIVWLRSENTLGAFWLHGRSVPLPQNFFRPTNWWSALARLWVRQYVQPWWWKSCILDCKTAWNVKHEIVTRKFFGRSHSSRLKGYENEEKNEYETSYSILELSNWSTRLILN